MLTFPALFKLRKITESSKRMLSFAAVTFPLWDCPDRANINVVNNNMTIMYSGGGVRIQISCVNLSHIKTHLKLWLITHHQTAFFCSHFCPCPLNTTAADIPSLRLKNYSFSLGSLASFCRPGSRKQANRCWMRSETFLSGAQNLCAYMHAYCIIFNLHMYAYAYSIYCIITGSETILIFLFPP